MTRVTLSCTSVTLAGIKSHGNWTSRPTAVCTSDSGPEQENENKIHIRKCMALIGFAQFDYYLNETNHQKVL